MRRHCAVWRFDAENTLLRMVVALGLIKAGAMLWQQYLRRMHALMECNIRRYQPVTQRRREVQTLLHDMANFVTDLNGRVGMLSLEIDEAAGDAPDANDARVSDEVAALEQSLGTLALFVRELRDVALNTGDVQFRWTVIEPGELVRRVAAHYAAAYRAEGLALVLDVQATPGMVADAWHLERALYNLLSNALRFSRGCAGGRVTVRVVADAEAIAITVADTGRGIDAESQSELLRRLVQYPVPPAPDERAAIGLGLHAVQQIAAAHGGTMSFFSPGPGQGTTVTIRIPTIRREQEVEPQRVTRTNV